MKTKWINIALWIAGAAFLLAVGMLCFALFMPHRDIRREEPVIISSIELVKAYQQDETAANRQFLDKAVRVTGVVSGIETNSEGRTIVTLPGPDPSVGVRCTLLENETIEIGSTVTLKAICSGYLSDVILIYGHKME